MQTHRTLGGPPEPLLEEQVTRFNVHRYAVAGLGAVLVLVLTGTSAQAAPHKPPPGPAVSFTVHFGTTSGPSSTASPGATVKPNVAEFCRGYVYRPYKLGSNVADEASYVCSPNPPALFGGWLKIWKKPAPGGPYTQIAFQQATVPTIPDLTYYVSAEDSACQHGWTYWGQFHAAIYYNVWADVDANSTNIVLC